MLHNLMVYNNHRHAMTKHCMHCLISGKVQGVWFRASTKEQAEKLNVKGYARNLNDGRVEVLACGEKANLEALYQWLQKGSLLSEVHACTRKILPWEEKNDFHIA